MLPTFSTEELNAACSYTHTRMSYLRRKWLFSSYCYYRSATMLADFHFLCPAIQTLARIIQEQEAPWFLVHWFTCVYAHTHTQINIKYILLCNDRILFECRFSLITCTVHKTSSDSVIAFKLWKCILRSFMVDFDICRDKNLEHQIWMSNFFFF